MRLDRLKLPRSLACVLTLTVLAAVAGPAAAQPDTWGAGTNGANVDFRYFTAGNWSLGVPTATSNATFSGIATGTVLFNTGAVGGAGNTGTLTFSGGPYTLGNGTAGDSLTINAASGINLTNSAGNNVINTQLIAAALSGNISGGSLTLGNTSAANPNNLTGTVGVGSAGTLTAFVAGTVGAGNVATPNATVTGSSSLGSATVVINGGTLNLTGKLIGTIHQSADTLNGSVDNGGLTGQFFDIGKQNAVTALIGSDGFGNFVNGSVDFLTQGQFSQLNTNFSGGTADRSRANALFNQLTPKTLGLNPPATTPTTVAVNANQTSALTPPADPNVNTFYNGGLNFPNIGSGVAFGQNTNTVPNAPAATNYPNIGQYQSGNHMARFSGLFQISPSGGGTYRFDTSSDDGSILYIDGKLLVFNNADQGAAGFGLGRNGPTDFTTGNPAATGAVNLTPGPHTIDVYYYQGGGGAALTVNYTGITGGDGSGFGQSLGGTGAFPNLALQGYQAKVALNNPVTVTGNATINVTQAFETDLGALTFSAGANLTTNASGVTINGNNVGGNGLLRFASTTFGGPATANYTVVASGNNDVALGTLNNPSAGAMASLVKQGTQNLILDGGNPTALGGGLVFQINSGRLQVVTDVTSSTNTNPLGTGSIVTIGSADGSGILQLRTRGATATATLNNRINVTNATGNASGALEVASNGAATLAVQLGAANQTALQVAQGSTLTLDTFSNTTLNVLGDLIGSGTILKGGNPNVAGAPTNTTPILVGGVQQTVPATPYVPPVFNGNGTLILSGNTSNFAGTLIVNTGTVLAPLTGVNTLLNSVGGSIVLDGPVFYYSLNKPTGNPNSTGFQNSTTQGAGQLSLTGGITYSGGAPITFKGGILNNTNGNNTISSPLNLGGLSFGVSPSPLPDGVPAIVAPTAQFNGASGSNLTVTAGLNDGGVGQGIAINSVNFTLNLQAPAISLVNGTFVNINGGTLNSNNATALGSLAAVNLATTSPVIFNVNASQTIGSLNGTGTTNLTANTLTIGNTNGLSGSYSGAITGVGGQVIKNGTGTQTFTGTSTYTAGTRINAGTLVAGNTTSLGTGAVTLAGGTLNVGNIQPVAGWLQDTIRGLADPTVAPFGTSTSVDNPTGSGFYEQGVNTGQPTFGLPNSRTFTSFANAGVTFQFQPYNKNNVVWLPTQNASGTLTITIPTTFSTLNILNTSGSGVSTYDVKLNFTDNTSTTIAGNTTPDWFNGANPALGGGGASPGLDRFNRSNGNFDNNGSNPRLYELDLTLSPTDAVKLLQSVTFTKTSATGTGFLNVYALSRNGAFLPTVTTSTYSNAVTALAGTTSNLTVSILSTTAATVNVGAMTFQAGSVLNVSADLAATTANTGYFLTSSSTTLVGTNTISIANNGTGLGTFAPGALSDAGTAATLTIAAPAVGTAGAVTLNNAATTITTGTLVNVNAGTLNLNAAGALGTLASVSVASTGTLNLGAAQTLGGLAGAGLVNLNGKMLMVGSTNNLSTTFSGVIADNAPAGGSLLKAGTGTLTLSGINTYTGGTTVAAGRLQVSNTVSGTNSGTGTGLVTIQGGAVLGGTGSLGGATTFNTGATLNPGLANTGPLTALSNVTLTGGAGSSWIVGLNNGTSGSSAANPLNLTGAGGLLNIITTGGNYTIDFEAVGTPTFVQGTSANYTIATVAAAGNLRLNGGAFPTTAAPGFTFTSNTIQFGAGSASLVASGSGTGLVLTFTPVPEPATVLAVCAIGGMGLAAWRRRQTGAAQA